MGLVGGEKIWGKGCWVGVMGAFFVDLSADCVL